MVMLISNYQYLFLSRTIDLSIFLPTLDIAIFVFAIALSMIFIKKLVWILVLFVFLFYSLLNFFPSILSSLPYYPLQNEQIKGDYIYTYSTSDNIEEGKVRVRVYIYKKELFFIYKNISQHIQYVSTDVQSEILKGNFIIQDNPLRLTFSNQNFTFYQ